MRDWLHIVHRAWSDTFDFFWAGGTLVTAIAIFFISVLLVRLVRGRDTVKEWWFDGKIGFWATVIVAGMFFIAHVLFISPVEVYQEEKAVINDQSNAISSLTIELQKQTEAQNKLEQKITEWQPPELEKKFDKAIVNYSTAQGVYEIQDLTNAVQFEINNQSNPEKFQGYHPMTIHVFNNRLYIDLSVPTPAKPIQIKSGKIFDLPAGWQCNGNSNVFEIVNAEVVPVFQEFYKYPNQFIIKGAVRSGDKVFFIDLNHQIQCGDFSAGLYSVGEYATKLDQYFAYPASEYPGEVFKK